jgi:NADH-quinone oxidoreductase subunit J
MDAMQLLFIVVAAATLGAALMVVTTRNLMHAALWLIATLFGIAVFYVLLSAGFLAVAQVVIYIGAIATLMIFVVMMTRRLVQDIRRQVNRGWWLAAILSITLFGGLSWMLSAWDGFFTQAAALPQGADPLVDLGQALVSPNAFILPFELASVLLLAAMIGAIMVAWERGR